MPQDNNEQPARPPVVAQLAEQVLIGLARANDVGLVKFVCRRLDGGVASLVLVATDDEAAAILEAVEAVESWWDAEDAAAEARGRIIQ